MSAREDALCVQCADSHNVDNRLITESIIKRYQLLQIMQWLTMDYTCGLTLSRVRVDIFTTFADRCHKEHNRQKLRMLGSVIYG